MCQNATIWQATNRFFVIAQGIKNQKKIFGCMERFFLPKAGKAIA
jgi:hypothetical protein